MQLLYGNDGVNYHTISKSEEMTEVQERELLKGYLGYDFVKNKELYSSASYEPVALSYVTTDLSRSLPEEKIVLSKNMIMTNYLTPSYYAHFHIMDKSLELYGEGFFDLLRYSFVEDVDINLYLEKDISEFSGEVDLSVPINRNTLDKKILYPIVAALLDAADNFSRKVKLILDVEGNTYNQRAIDVIASIYQYIPYTLRNKIGFTTYAGAADAKVSNRIKLQLYPREMGYGLGMEAIDLANPGRVERILSRVSENAKRLTTDFMKVDDKERIGWFQTFQTLFQMNDVTLEEHATVFKNIGEWQNGNLEDKIVKFAKYALEENKKEEKTIVYEIFCKIMNQRFQKEGYTVRYLEIICSLVEQQKSFAFDSNLKAFIMLGESVESVSFDAEPFLCWEQNRVIAEAEKRYEGVDLVKALKKQCQECHKSKNGGAKFGIVNQQMEDLLNNHIAKQVELLREKMKKEELDIEKFFESGLANNISSQMLKERFDTIYFGDNRQVFCQSLYRYLTNILEGIPYFRSYEEYQQYKAFLIDCKKFFSKKEYSYLQLAMQERGRDVEDLYRSRNVKWANKQDILLSYGQIVITQMVAQEKNLEIPKYSLEVGRGKYDIWGENLKYIIEYLLAADEFTGIKIRGLLNDSDFIENIMRINVLGDMHFCFLFECLTDSGDKQRLLEYYVGNKISLTDNDVNRVLNQMKPATLQIGRIEADRGHANIIGIVLRNKINTESLKANYQERGQQRENGYKDGDRQKKHDEKEKMGILSFFKKLFHRDSSFKKQK